MYLSFTEMTTNKKIKKGEWELTLQLWHYIKSENKVILLVHVIETLKVLFAAKMVANEDL